MNYSIWAALSFAAYTYIRLGISKEAAWRAEVFGQSGRSYRENVIKWLEHKSSSGLQARLDRIGVPITELFTNRGTHDLRVQCSLRTRWKKRFLGSSRRRTCLRYPFLALLFGPS